MKIYNRLKGHRSIRGHQSIQDHRSSLGFKNTPVGTDRSGDRVSRPPPFYFLSRNIRFYRTVLPPVILGLASLLLGLSGVFAVSEGICARLLLFFSWHEKMIWQRISSHPFVTHKPSFGFRCKKRRLNTGPFYTQGRGP